MKSVQQDMRREPGPRVMAWLPVLAGIFTHVPVLPARDTTRRGTAAIRGHDQT
jgi:hypothetical protein